MIVLLINKINDISLAQNVFLTRNRTISHILTAKLLCDHYTQESSCNKISAQS